VRHVDRIDLSVEGVAMAAVARDTRPTRMSLKLLLGGACGLVVALAAIYLIDRQAIRGDDYLPVTMGAIYLVLGLTVCVNPSIRSTSQPDERLWLRAAAMVTAAGA